MPSYISKPIPARVDEDPMEPPLEQVSIAQGVPLPPGRYERVMGGVLGLIALTEDRMGEPIAGVEVAIRKRPESLGALRTCSSADIACVHGLRPTRFHAKMTPGGTETFRSP
jgi:hypothetical protein